MNTLARVVHRLTVDPEFRQAVHRDMDTALSVAEIHLGKEERHVLEFLLKRLTLPASTPYAAGPEGYPYPWLGHGELTPTLLESS